MTKDSIPQRTVGLDVGKKWTRYAFGEGDRGAVRVLDEGAVRTTPEALAALLQSKRRLRVVLEAGPLSPWISRHAEGLGHEVIVADARKLALIYKSHKKNDREDARKLMELGHVNVTLLSPVQHRSAQAQAQLAVLNARSLAVGIRTKTINFVRSNCAAMGVELASCSAPAFHKKCGEAIPRELKLALAPLLKTLKHLTEQIRRYDRKIEALSTKHPATQRLREVNGVGPLTATCFVLSIENPKRFERSRDVAAYFGLCPRQDETGGKPQQRPISKAGNSTMRRLLVGSAQYILGPFGEDCDLRRWGLKLCERGGKNGKKRAAVAVARKLAVLLHALWRKPGAYEPLRHSEAQEAKTGRRTRDYRLTGPSTRRPGPSVEGAATMGQ